MTSSRKQPRANLYLQKMEIKDAAANTITLLGITMTMAEFQTMMTITVLFTALVLNVVRIFYTIKTKKG